MIVTTIERERACDEPKLASGASLSLGKNSAPTSTQPDWEEEFPKTKWFVARNSP